MNVAPSRTRETIHRCDQGLGSKIPEFTGLHVALIRPEALERSPGGAQDAFRVRRLFHTSGVPPAQQGSFFSSFHSMGWQHPSTAFLVLATAPEPAWSPRAGSSKMFRKIATLSRCVALSVPLT